MAMNFIWLATLVLTQGILASLAYQFQTPKLDIKSKLRRDRKTLSLAADDFGHLVHKIPKAVLEPTSVSDISDLIKRSNSLPTPFPIAARGQAHCVHGQVMTNGSGIVVNMTSLSGFRNGSGIVVSNDGGFADVGGEQLWIDVLHATLERGLTPLAWTDLLYVSVGGTLSNAGVNGQAFRIGPQISNVLELDVVTGIGDPVTCSPENNSDLFYAALGGLGQFGVITRARIPLGPAPTRAKWLRLLYSNFSDFSGDQEHLISFNERNDTNAPNFVEGIVLLNSPAVLNLSFYPPSDQPRIKSLVAQYDIIYAIELVKYYDNSSQAQIDKQVAKLVNGLKFVPTFVFEKDVSYEEFINRFHGGEPEARDIRHVWINLFVPRSRISDFNEGVVKGIILKQNISTDAPLAFPMNRNKWDDRMSAVIPDEDVFYGFFTLTSTRDDHVKEYQNQNQQILQFCKDSGIMVVEYLPVFETHQEWVEHFGPKWQTFEDRKDKFDPKRILAPGQGIFQ